ncbi:PEP-CTERM sorting domain-containing protein [Patescibacteria group bacterium]|nr:PEP-CTERM sorting domain-containing protein [Patescibacteria group bacterium]MBU4367927.1 PEP-CTERM sorting domain-containing protein [Patescibacteria group bacterium]MBU4462265.1 PEP-CTERM sorting domain-containing protein [Patescibacteria group bacterium]MCG2699537.1 PEP-CTERM sorting domain-containing protein [Candidatus Parcubacteria bacterium]
MMKTMMMVAMLCMVSGQAMAAGGGTPSIPTSYSPSLYGGFYLPGEFSAYWRTSDDKNGHPSAALSMNLESPLMQVTDAGWSFSPNYYNTNNWSAYFSVSGYFLQPKEQQKPFNLGQEGNISHGDLTMYLGTHAGIMSEYGDGGKIIKEYQTISGDFNISPSLITYSTFNYNEYDCYWKETEPVTRYWYAQFTVNGEFTTIPDMPEPATLGFLAMGGSALLLKRWRRS